MSYLKLAKHYNECFEKHGDTHLGVDWPKYEDTLIRHQVMMDLIKDKNTNNSLLDFGCGLGHLYEFIFKKNYI